MKADLTCDRPRDKSNVTRDYKQRLGKKNTQQRKRSERGGAVSGVAQPGLLPALRCNGEEATSQEG